MFEPANSVSNAMSLPLKAAGSGRVELTASLNNTRGKNSAFSNDLDQARKVQLDNTQAPIEQRNDREQSNQASLTGSMNRQQPATSSLAGQSGGKALPSDSMVDVSGLHDVVDGLITREVDKSTPPLLSAIPEPLTDGVTKNVTFADSLKSTKTFPNSRGEDPITSAGTVQRHAPDGAESTPVNPLAVVQKNSEAANYPVGQDVTQVTLSGRSEQSATSLNVIGTAGSTVRDTHLPPPALSAAEAQGVIKEQLPNEQTMNAAVRKPISEYSATPVHTTTPVGRQAQRSGVALSTAESTAAHGLVKTPALSGLDGSKVMSGQPLKELPTDALAGKSAMEPVTAPARAATAVNMKVYRSGVVTTEPEPLVPGQPGKTSTSMSDATGLIQPAPGYGVVTQPMLGGRFQRLSGSMAALGRATPQLVDGHGSTQPVVASSSAGKSIGLVAGATSVSLVNESVAGIEPQALLIETNATVHQRLAATEAILSQMAQEAGGAVSRVPTAEATLLPVAGGVVSTVLLQHSEPATVPVAQAPLTLNLASADAETTLAGNVKWMTNEGVKNAVMTVTPHGMGSISVKIGIVGDQMDVSIIASQHTTRDALESMLPRLREQLAVQGHESVKVDVSDGKGEQARSGNGQAFSDSRNPTGTMPQDSQSNSSKRGERTEPGGSDELELVSESVMAEDLQRVAERVVGEAGRHPVFDAYV